MSENINSNEGVVRLNIIDERLNNHEERINKNTDDISEIKVITSVQSENIKNLNKSIDKLTEVIEKTVTKFDDFKDASNGRTIETWKVILISVAIPTIFFLLNYLANH